MQSVFVIITTLIASKIYFCKEVSCNNFGRDGICAAPPAEAHPRKFVVKTIRSESICSLPLSFILIKRVIVASLQVMARNEKGGRGVPRSLSLFSWGLKGAERAERKTGWLYQNRHEIWLEVVRETLFFRARNFARNVERKIWAYDLQHPKCSHIFPACLCRKFHACFRIFFWWGFSLLLTLFCLAANFPLHHG